GQGRTRLRRGRSAGGELHLSDELYIGRQGKPGAASASLSKGGEAVERRSKLVIGRRPSPDEALLVSQTGPVIGMGDPRPGRADRLKCPRPAVSWRILSGLCRLSGDPSALLELAH